MTEDLEGERTISAVSVKKPWFTPRRKAALIGAGTIVVLGFVYWKNPGQRKEDDVPQPPAAGMGQAVAYDPPKPQAMPAAFSAPIAVAPAALPPPVTPVPLPQPPPIASVIPAAAKPPHPARMLSYATEGLAKQAGAPGGGGEGAASAGGTRVTYKGAAIVGAKAGPALDRDLLLMPGIIRCILDTAVDSTLPGPLMCHLPAPVMSSSGVILMEKDTSIIGQYTNSVTQGQGRLMAVTATAYTPNGIPVPMGGPFADGLGRTGLDGNVDNHVMERFGGAVMLSLAEGAMGIAQSAISKGGNSYVSFSSGGVGSLAQEVLRNTIDIKPTITKDQGDEVALWILTPIDFSQAYHLGSKDR